MANTTGKYFRGRIGATIMSGLTDGDVQENGDELDATSAENEGFTDTDVGCTGLEVTLSGNHIVGSGPFPNLRAGTILTNLIIWLQASNPSSLAGPRWTMPSVVVLQGASAVKIRDKILWRCKIKTKGTYSYLEA